MEAVAYPTRLAGYLDTPVGFLVTDDELVCFADHLSLSLGGHDRIFTCTSERPVLEETQYGALS